MCFAELFKEKKELCILKKSLVSLDYTNSILKTVKIISSFLLVTSKNYPL